MLLDSWTVSLTRELLPRMDVSSVLRFRSYSLREAQGRLRQNELLNLKMKSPINQRISLREIGSDILTFNEVLLDQVYKTVLSHVPECKTVIDLGANIGLSSIFFAAHYPGCRIFAVEPNPSSNGMLNINLNKLISEGRCATLRAAVWGTERDLQADPTLESEHYSVFSMVERSSARLADSGITGMPITQIIERSGFDHIDLLKVDIEGAETELFKGDVNWLKRVGCIAIEFHQNSREITDFNSLMHEYGFSIDNGDQHTIVAVRLANP